MIENQGDFVRSFPEMELLRMVSQCKRWSYRTGVITDEFGKNPGHKAGKLFKKASQKWEIFFQPQPREKLRIEKILENFNGKRNFLKFTRILFKLKPFVLSTLT